jgi:hypothetical protein
VFRHWLRLLPLTLVLAAGAAPLFPDAQDSAWARDAVARLAEHGLLEGYPSGRFLGDRAATRWELALLVARLLARAEQERGLLAERGDLETVRRLAAMLGEELQALGVRLNLLEENLGRLDQRLEELSRISFYGEFQARASLQSFSNQGSFQSNPVQPLLPYQQMVGNLSGAGDDVGVGPAAKVDFNPRIFGVTPVADLRGSTPLTNGSAWTSRLLLGLRVSLDPEEDLSAGLELAAYNAQGNQVVDAYAGVSAPYLSNAFTGQTGPWTSMTLDHFWVRHGPSATTLTVGAFRSTTFDGLVYRPQPNPNLFGPRFLDNYGVQIKGQRVEVNDDLLLDYEAIYTRLADGNEGVDGLGYFSHAEGGTLGASFDEHRGRARFSLLHACNEAASGASLQPGLLSKANQLSATPWVDPNGFAGISNLGPQDQLSWGLSAGYQWDAWIRPQVSADWATSLYSPQRTSPYSTRGQAWRLGFECTLPWALREELEEGQAEQPEDYLGLNLQAQYLSVDARYDPFVLQVPRLVGANSLYRLPDNNYSAYLYPLHDTVNFPHNRQGFRLKGDWQYHPDGHLEVSYSNLRQNSGSLPDVLTPAGVRGFSAGFVDSVFGGLAAETFGAGGRPLENPLGKTDSLALSLFQHWSLEPDSSRQLTLKLSGGLFDFRRSSNLARLLPGPAGLVGENINRVNLRYLSTELELGYDWSEAVRTRLGYFRAEYRGHLDPFGVYGPYAVSVGQAGFDNFNLTQNQPFLGLEWQIDPQTSFDFELRGLFTHDHLPASVFPTPTQPAANLTFAPQFSAHPFSWSGYRLTSGMSVKF